MWLLLEATAFLITFPVISQSLFFSIHCEPKESAFGAPLTESASELFSEKVVLNCPVGEVLLQLPAPLTTGSSCKDLDLSVKFR